MKKILALLLALASPAFGQSVQQSGTITPGNAAKWITNGVIGDGGSLGTGASLNGNFTINDFLCSNATSASPLVIDCGLSATGTNNWVGLQNFNGGGTSTTPAAGDSSTKIATTAFVSGSVASAARTRLLADTTFYVNSSTGNDSNLCTLAAPCLTPQRGWDYVADNYDANGHVITIQLTGTAFTSGIKTSKCVLGANSPGSVAILGAGATATTTAVTITVNGADVFNFGGPTVGYNAGNTFGCTQATVAGIKCVTTTSGNCVIASGGGVGITVGASGSPMEFGSVAENHIVGAHNAWIIGGTNNLVSGGGVTHVTAESGARVALHNTTETITGTPAFSTAYAFANTGATLYMDAMTFTGSATGVRWLAFSLGALYTLNDSATYIPGSTAGAAVFGGKQVRATNYYWEPSSGGTGSDLSATGGTSQVLQQTTVGGNVTVGQLACANLSNGATGCSTATGTSGATIPLLNGNNTFSGTSTHSGQIISTTGLPTIASGACGTTTNGAVVAGSTNQSGNITIGAAATTTCTITWSATLAVAPNACVFFPANATGADTNTTRARVGAPSTAQVVLTGSALANANYSYICL